jgi:response regulator RpfG family c-di-GMP phosphodiesterase
MQKTIGRSASPALTGYPPVPAGWRQHLASHITTISDIFDALCTKRAYRDAREIRKTARFLESLAGTELHPQLTENFLEVVERNLPDPDAP